MEKASPAAVAAGLLLMYCQRYPRFKADRLPCPGFNSMMKW